MAEQLSRADLISLVEKLLLVDGTDDEIHQWILQLEANVLDPEVSNYIFWPDRPMSAEDIVDRALSYKPIQL